jgi:hypothetical protein
MKHPQSEIIKVWVEETTELWVWLEESKEWKKSYILEVITCPNLTYAIGDKPTSPPVKMCELAGVKFPAPFKNPFLLKSNTKYWVAENNFKHVRYWESSPYDVTACEAGFIHLTEEGAEQHYEALVAANLQAIKEAK